MSESKKDLSRRSLMKGAVAGGALAAASRVSAKAKADTRKRHAIVGVGSRSRMYQDAIWGDHKATSSIVAICDTNPGRLALTARRGTEMGAAAPKTYLASDFDKMIRETKPEVVIVTTPCALHEKYIVRALELGCDVVTEKAMTTTPEMAKRILDTCERTGKHIRVTHNYRYAPFRTQVKELLMAGEIGDILSVDFHWLLNTTHGADYFRRWHSKKSMSGGLMIHKASHHFDLVNWWLSAQPVSVSAMGKKEFYTPQMAKRFGLAGAHERCLTCPEKDKCGFYLDISADKGLKSLYLDQEKYDGYFRDQCVWRPEIDIEDNMNVVVAFDTGCQMAYSLNANNAWEGYTIAFNGTKGRLEHTQVESVYVAGADMVQGGVENDKVKIRVYPLRGAPRDIKPRIGEGGHGGGDAVMLAELFGSAPADPTLRAANELGGAASAVVGMAANKCFETGGTVQIADLLPGLKKPNLPPMPTRADPVPMPPKWKRG